jgi:hypothetical protein
MGDLDPLAELDLDFSNSNGPNPNTMIPNLINDQSPMIKPHARYCNAPADLYSIRIPTYQARDHPIPTLPSTDNPIYT